MGLVVIAYFRIWIPSLVVILCAFSDIFVTIAVFNLTGMKLSTAGLAAFLMLIGYSIDTDILLTSRVLHRKEGTVMDRIYSSISTGMTMTITTISVVAVALFFVKSETIRQIMLIILIGMFVDMIMTWIQNVGLLRLYLNKKEKKVNNN
jgi:preprotein translocase subunit SecF